MPPFPIGERDVIAFLIAVTISPALVAAVIDQANVSLVFFLPANAVVSFLIAALVLRLIR